MRWAGSRAQGPILMARRGLCCRAACCVRAWCVSEAARLGRVAHAGGHAAQRAQVRRHQRLRKRRRRVRPRLALVVDAEHEHLRDRWSRIAPSPALGAVGALQGDGLARAAPAGAPRPGRQAGARLGVRDLVQLVRLLRQAALALGERLPDLRGALRRRGRRSARGAARAAWLAQRPGAGGRRRTVGFSVALRRALLRYVVSRPPFCGASPACAPCCAAAKSCCCSRCWWSICWCICTCCSASPAPARSSVLVGAHPRPPPRGAHRWQTRCASPRRRTQVEQGARSNRTRAARSACVALRGPHLRPGLPPAPAAAPA